MKFAIVRPRERSVEIVDVPGTDEAKALAGLPLDETDNGTLCAGLGYICHEHAMFTHPQFYSRCGLTLLAGNIVMFAFDEAGETVDYDVELNIITFVGDEVAVEAAIQAGWIDRPQMTIDGKVYWLWPQPRPDMEGWAQKVAAAMMQGPVQIDDITIFTTDDERRR